MGFAGIDRSDYPGDDTMDWLKANTNLVWTGFYLPSPCHPTSTWIGQSTNDATKTIYQYLVDGGWGLAALFLGQQDVNYARCSQHNLSGAAATADASMAVQQATSAGFPSGSVIFLDIEQGGIVGTTDPNNCLGYITAWINNIAQDGTFHPGVYCSHSQTADQISQAVNAINPSLNVKFWVWNLANPAGTCPAISNNTYPSDDPTGSGISYASVWQQAQCCTIQVGGSSLNPVDFDSADSANPSAPISSSNRKQISKKRS
jgi:hypothetical protein